MRQSSGIQVHRSRDSKGKFVDETGPIFEEGVHYDVVRGCWQWRGKLNKGYARSNRGKKLGLTTILAHRISYEYFVGPIPSGLELDHICHNRGCVNPEHLEPVTRQENVMRGDTGKVTMEQREEIRVIMAELTSKYRCTARTLAAIYEDRSYAYGGGRHQDIVE